MIPRSVLILGCAMITLGCARGTPAKTPAKAPMTLPADATAIDFTLVSGSAAATSMRSRSIALGDEEVVLAPSGLYGESTRSRAWWEETRSLLDHGLANATADTTAGSGETMCAEPSNAVCGFELRVTTPRGEEHLQGCCTERSAHNVEAAFRRLVPPR